MRNRKKQRENRRLKYELLNLKDICGINDPTPYEAVKKIIRTSRKTVKQKGHITPDQTKGQTTPKPTETD